MNLGVWYQHAILYTFGKYLSKKATVADKPSKTKNFITAYGFFHLTKYKRQLQMAQSK